MHCYTFNVVVSFFKLLFVFVQPFLFKPSAEQPLYYIFFGAVIFRHIFASGILQAGITGNTHTIVQRIVKITCRVNRRNARRYINIQGGFHNLNSGRRNLFPWLHIFRITIVFIGIQEFVRKISKITCTWYCIAICIVLRQNPGAIDSFCIKFFFGPACSNRILILLPLFIIPGSAILFIKSILYGFYILFIVIIYVLIMRIIYQCGRIGFASSVLRIVLHHNQVLGT